MLTRLQYLIQPVAMLFAIVAYVVYDSGVCLFKYKI